MLCVYHSKFSVYHSNYGVCKENRYVFKCYGGLQDFIHYTGDCSIRWKKFFEIKIVKILSADYHRPNGLAILTIKRNMFANVDYEKIIDDFASRNARRHHFKWFVNFFIPGLVLSLYVPVV